MAIVKIETLAMLKMEKNFIALDKGYPRKPYERYSVYELLNRLEQETKELKNAICEGNIPEIQLECADVSNIIDYIFEKTKQLFLK